MRLETLQDEPETETTEDDLIFVGSDVEADEFEEVFPVVGPVAVKEEEEEQIQQVHDFLSSRCSVGLLPSCVP